MVLITNRFPLDSDPDLLVKLRKQESLRALELSREGILKKLWRRPGQRANVGIWVARDATVLHEALESLPFYPWLDIEIWPLAKHPNDPEN